MKTRQEIEWEVFEKITDEIQNHYSRIYGREYIERIKILLNFAASKAYYLGETMVRKEIEKQEVI